MPFGHVLGSLDAIKAIGTPLVQGADHLS